MYHRIHHIWQQFKLSLLIEQITIENMLSKYCYYLKAYRIFLSYKSLTKKIIISY